MYAIIKSGGKQYRVKKDDVIDVELLGLEPGEKVEFNDVLFINNDGSPTIGQPTVSGFTVKGELVDIVKGPKITSLKYKKRKQQRRKFGHRQRYARVKIVDIVKSA